MLPRSHLRLALALSLSSNVRGTCNQDNCLRALIRSSAAASSFCASYTSKPYPYGLPSFVAACQDSPARISSACACIATPTATSTLSSSTVSTSTSSATATATCEATSNWPGWEGIKHAFIFGDSYTTTGFNTSLVQPSPTNPLGNPTYPGYTASNGPNWVDYITVKYNASLLLTYNLAYGGATINSALVAPYLPTVSSVAEQIQNEWFPAYASKPATAPWSSNDTLFAIFDGINDVGNTYYNGVTASITLNAEIFAVYQGLVDELYNAGGRNFLFLNVPPVDRSPGTTIYPASTQALEKADVLAWNTLIISMAQSLKKLFSDINIFTVDTNLIFTQILDNPKSNPFTAGYLNTTAYCVAYENGTPTEDYYNSTCGIPVNEYFWLNTLHPTYPMQDVLAEGVAAQLNAGPNIC